MKKSAALLAIALSLLTFKAFACDEVVNENDKIKVVTCETLIRHGMMTKIFGAPRYVISSRPGAEPVRDGLVSAMTAHGLNTVGKDLKDPMLDGVYAELLIDETYAGKADTYRYRHLEAEDNSEGTSRLNVPSLVGGAVVAGVVCATFRSCDYVTKANLVGVPHSDQITPGSWHPDLDKEKRQFFNVVDTEICRLSDKTCFHTVAISYAPEVTMQDMRKASTDTIMKALNF